MRQPYSYNKKGLTLVEVLVSVLLISIVFLAVSALYVSSQKIYFVGNDKAIISYEFQYAIEHIYKNVMRAIGDNSSPAISVPDVETLNININDNDPLARGNYGDVVTYTYSKSGDALMFNNSTSSESLVQKVTVSAVNFSLSGNILTISLTGSYKDQTLSFYAACYPRLATFN